MNLLGLKNRNFKNHFRAGMEKNDSLENNRGDMSERNQRWSLTEGCLPLKLIIYTNKALVS